MKTRAKCVRGVRGWVELGRDHRNVVIPFYMWSWAGTTEVDLRSWVGSIEKPQLSSICQQ